MIGYPDPDYAGAPNYDVESGTGCGNAKPYAFWEGGTFCKDVTILGSLTTSSLEVDLEPVVVGDVQYEKTLFKNSYDGRYYYVLANKLPKDFVPPPPPPD
jgi:YHS domain-containing protein